MATRRIVRIRAENTSNTPVATRTARRLAARDDETRASADGPVPLQVESPLSEFLKVVRGKAREHRGGPYAHVSDLIHGCMRKQALCEKYNVSPRPRVLTLGDRFTFAQGEAIHDAAKQMFVEAAPDEIWGKWSCKCGHLYHEEPCTLSETDTDEVCPHCHTRCDIYQEVSIFDDDLMVVGNPDLVHFLKAPQAFHISELKSISHEQWKELVRPLPDHVLQVVFYWYLMNKRGYRLTDKVSILYVTKGWVFGHKEPYKEFVLNVQAELPRINDLIEDARMRKSSQNGDRLPYRSKCPTMESKDAKACEVCQICFQER